LPLWLTLHVVNPKRYFLELLYNGTGYHGWQVQPNALTVQELLNKALSTLLRQPIETTGCGRTDAGVHATQFFAHFDVVGDTSLLGDGSLLRDSLMFVDHRKHGDSTTPLTIDHEPSSINYEPTSLILEQKKIIRSLNALLPYDIAVKRIINLHSDAHARFDASLRSYQYRVHFEKDPFLQGFSWLQRDRPEVDLMNEAAAILMQYTDFSCFSKSNTQVATNNCKISRAEWLIKEDQLVFHISADRFLRNMVRAIVGTLLLVGQKEIIPQKVRQIIESKNRSNAGTSVPACGLYLTEVKYPYL
jgi:tRNA pseudouridine38-40 synthase